MLARWLNGIRRDATIATAGDESTPAIRRGITGMWMLTKLSPADRFKMSAFCRKAHRLMSISDIVAAFCEQRGGNGAFRLILDEEEALKSLSRYDNATSMKTKWLIPSIAICFICEPRRKRRRRLPCRKAVIDDYEDFIHIYSESYELPVSIWFKYFTVNQSMKQSLHYEQMPAWRLI